MSGFTGGVLLGVGAGAVEAWKDTVKPMPKAVDASVGEQGCQHHLGRVVGPSASGTRRPPVADVVVLEAEFQKLGR